MRMSKLIPTALLPLAAGACLGGGSSPSELLTLTATQAPPPGATTSAAGGSVLVLVPSVAEAINTKRIPVYVTPITIQYLTNATYVEEPAELFRRLVAETIAARTGRLVLSPDLFSQAAAVTLSGQLLQFGFVPDRMEVVVAFEAAVIRDMQPLRTQRFEARVPVTTKDASTIAPALNLASNQVAEQVADWIGR